MHEYILWLKKNQELFWVRMKDMQDGLGVENICDLLKKEMRGIYGLKDLTKEQKKKYTRSEYKITKEFIGNNKNKYAKVISWKE